MSQIVGETYHKCLNTNHELENMNKPESVSTALRLAHLQLFQLSHGKDRDMQTDIEPISSTITKQNHILFCKLAQLTAVVILDQLELAPGRKQKIQQPLLFSRTFNQLRLGSSFTLDWLRKNC